ncbi:hypothetical protein CRUP_012079 [Coryphaenoides rupestris]|nr:hypothetical protein CRUP_012079 [Coryphaenoides rupestris]
MVAPPPPPPAPRTMSHVLLHLLVVLLLLCCAPSRAEESRVEEESWEVLLLHTNDVHARVEEISGDAGRCAVGPAPCFGGAARRATAVAAARAQGLPVLLLDAGDQFQGSAWFNMYRGAEAARFMNLLRYDAMYLGYLKVKFDRAGNVVEATGNPILLDSSIPKDPVVADEVANWKRNLSIYSSQVVGKTLVYLNGTFEECRFRECNLGNLICDAMIDNNIKFADELQWNHVSACILNGGSVRSSINEQTSDGTPPSTEVPAGPYPFTVRSDDGRQVPVVQAYAFGKYLGYLKVKFDRAGNVVEATGNPILLDSSIPKDPVVADEVANWKRNLSIYSSQVVGKTLVYLNGTFEECRFRECNLGNLICDANGDITVEDLLAVMPFGGTFDLVQLRGATLRQAFEHSVSRYGLSSGQFLQVSGIRVEYDLSQVPGQRVRSLRMLCTECRVPRYEEVEAESLYKVVLPSYLVTGGDGFSMIRDEKLKHDSGDMDISVLENYITERRKVHPAVEGRITFYKSAGGPATRPAARLLLVLLGLACILYGYGGPGL